MLNRTSFRFSAEGTRVACLTAACPGAWRVESWQLVPHATAPEVHEGLTVRGPSSQVLPTGDGRVLLCQATTDDARTHELSIGGPDGTTRTLATTRALGLRVLEHPRADVLATAVSTETTPELSSVIWLVRDATPTLEPVCRVPGLLAGGSWLDSAGGRLGLNQARQGTLTAVVADLASGSVQPLWPAPAQVRLLFATPDGGHLIVGDPEGAVGWAEPGDTVGWSGVLDGSVGAFPIAADTAGRVALRVDRGASSGLAVYVPGEDRVEDVPLPAGSVGATGSWVAGTLRIPFAAADRPASVLELRPGASAARSSPVREAAPTPDSSALHLETFTCPAGPIEAVVHGDWREAADVVLALHGGPDAAWRLDHGPLLTELAGADTAVVAVNPRSSRGYRGAHEALRDGWAGADLADVHTVAAMIRAHRGTPVGLFGVSYGAYLAVLALASRPGLWTRAAVVAPFLSGPRLFAEGSAGVRALLDRLGAARDTGAGDLTELADRIAAPLLLVHGTADEVIPVAHCRELADRLRAADAAVDYVELTGTGHDPLSGPAAQAVLTRIRDFLSGALTGTPEGFVATTDPCGGRQLTRERR